jgi:hypothetical protein
VDSIERAREVDPQRTDATELLTRWSKCIGLKKAVSASKVKEIANAVKAIDTGKRDPVYRYPNFRALLVEHAGRGEDIDTGRLGIWLRQESIPDDDHFQQKVLEASRLTRSS